MPSSTKRFQPALSLSLANVSHVLFASPCSRICSILISPVDGSRNREAGFGYVRTVVLLLTFLGSLATAVAQSTTPLSINPTQENGYKPFGSFRFDKFDSVNLMNLQLDVHIPLATYPQRGGKLTLGFELSYVSGSVDFTQRGNNNPNDPPIYENTGTVPGFYVRPLFGAYLAAGDYPGQTALNIVSPVDGNHYSVVSPSSSGSTFYAIDSSGWMANTNDSRCPQYAPISVVSSDGIINCGSWNSEFQSTAPNYAPMVMMDTNGNTILNNNTFVTESNPPTYALRSGPGGTLTDTIGRTIPLPPFLPNGVGLFSPNSQFTTSSYCTGPLPTLGAVVWNVPGEAGSSLPYTFCASGGNRQGHLIVCLDPSGVYAYADATTVSGCPNGSPGPGEVATSSTPATLQSLVLPNNAAWTFQYDPMYQDVTSITTPYGETVTYTWTDFSVQQGNCSEYAQYWQFARAIASRTVDTNDGTGPHTWTYTQIPSTAANGGGVGGPSYGVQVTNPDGSYEIHTFQDLQTVGESCSYYETSTQFYSPTGKLLEQKANTYNTLPAPSGYGGGFGVSSLSPVLTSTVTTLDNGQQSTTQENYDAGVSVYFGSSGGAYSSPATVRIGDVVAKRTYDYGNGAPGTLLSAVDTTYVWQQQPSYLSAGLTKLAASTCVALAGLTSCTGSPSDSSSYSTFGYDQSGSPQGTLGNATSVNRWLNSTNQTLTTSAVYNSQGMPTETVDANGAATSLIYDATGMFLRESVQPVTNGVNHNEFYSFDGTTGLLSSHTDQNGSGPSDPAHTTVFTYDNVGRLETLRSPDGGGESISYTDTVSPSALVTTLTGGSTGPIVRKVIYDGEGRVLQAQTLSDPQGTDYIDTTYDSMGRVASVSNPYRTKGEPTYGLTSYGYDGLGRKTIQSQPDGASLHWGYTGNATLNTDENGNVTSRVSDAFGRLTTVVEAAGQTTTYSYDVLGNLKTVIQNGILGSGDVVRSRTFFYDSLSRLVRATNPETGTISYCTVSGGMCLNGYDNNGNLLSKTDARGVVTTFSYDALNRLVAKHAGGTQPGAGGLASCFLYDANSAASTANAVSRLVAEWTQSGSCPQGATSVPATGVLTSKVITAYDSMGRVLTQQTCALNSCTSAHPQIYSYDQAGHLTGYTDAIGANSFTQSYDAAGRLLGLTSSQSTTNPPAALFSVTQYGAVGWTGATMGGALTLSQNFDVRQRVTTHSVVAGVSQ